MECEVQQTYLTVVDALAVAEMLREMLNDVLNLEFVCSDFNKVCATFCSQTAFAKGGQTSASQLLRGAGFQNETLYKRHIEMGDLMTRTRASRPRFQAPATSSCMRHCGPQRRRRR